MKIRFSFLALAIFFSLPLTAAPNYLSPTRSRQFGRRGGFT